MGLIWKTDEKTKRRVSKNFPETYLSDHVLTWNRSLLALLTFFGSDKSVPMIQLLVVDVFRVINHIEYLLGS